LSYSRPFLSNATAPPVLYPLSLHDALPISLGSAVIGSLFALRLVNIIGERLPSDGATGQVGDVASLTPNGVLDLPDSVRDVVVQDRKSTRLNSSHVKISYAVFCLKKKTTAR